MSTSATPPRPTDTPEPGGELKVYDASYLYDLAFSFRDYPGEVDLLTAWYRRARGQDQLQSVLELAAGPATHAIELARRGARATGLDLSPSMCAYAEQKAALAGVPLGVACANMVDFDLPERFDLALLLMTSGAHLYTLDELVTHLGTVARHLEPRGVYIIELPHPGDFLGRGDRPPGVGVGLPWTVVREGLELTTTWGRPSDPYDPLRQVFTASVELRAREGGREQVLREQVPMRDWTYTELLAAIRLSAVFEVVETHGDYGLDAPFDATPASWRMILVLRRAR